ncbi:MAG: hypothetical protein NC212_01920 [Staphylococcus sp.]|nr:hypothetical protein [Staphylococcus sp.]
MIQQFSLRSLLLAIIFITTICSNLSAETLLQTSEASSIAIVSNKYRTTITVRHIDGGPDNFYYQSDKQNRQKKSGSTTETHINFSDITDISVNESETEVTVSFTSPEGEPLSYTFKFSDPDNRSVKSYIGRKGSDFGFTIARNSYLEWSAISKGLGFGWVSPLNATPDMNTSMWKSNELTWMMIAGVSMTHGRHSLSFGLGIDWQNFVTKGDLYFDKNTDGLISLRPYEEGATEKRSRIKIFSLQLPILYELRFGHNRNLGLNIGPVINFNTSASIKTQYHLNGHEYSVKTNHIGQRPVTVDAIAVVNYKAIGVYFRYSPMKKLRAKTDLDFNSLSTGVMLMF